MSGPAHQKMRACVSAMLACLMISQTYAADRRDTSLPPHPPGPPIDRWEVLVTPYGWLTGLKGTQTVRGRTTRVDASFTEIAKQSDTLVALMGNVEARRGPLAFYADLVWTKLGVNDNNIRTRSLVPGVTTSIGEALKLNIQMTIAEAGLAHEVSRRGTLGFDLLGGARYWHQKADLSYEAKINTDIGDLDRVGSRAFARSGSVQWLDPLVGARIRYAPSAGHELFLRGDVGGFGAGSKFSWQVLGGYGFHVGAYKNLLFSGVIGYRLLAVTFARGSGTQRYEYNMLEYGPLLGLNIRF